MFVIKYTPCALNSTGKGTETFYNEDGAVNAADLAALFATAKATRGLLGIDVYEAQLISCASSAVLHLGGGYVNDSIAPDDELALAYSHAFLINGGTVDGGKIDVPGGGGTPAQVLTRTTVLTPAQATAMAASPVELVPAPGAGKVVMLLQAAVVVRNTGKTPYTTVGASSLVVAHGGVAGNSPFSFVGTGIMSQTGDEMDVISSPAEWGRNVLSAFENLPLMLTQQGDEFAAGDGIVTVQVTYSILDLS